MAPTTNIGSSTPIESTGANIGSDLRRKEINDAVASLTALAQAHHRNTTWPGLAVRVASNLTASQALKMHVIDMIAPSLPALLDRLNGYRTKDAQRPYTLHLAGAQIDTVKPGFVTRLLNTVIDPNLISILFLAGIVGLIWEVIHPGIVLPGALGAVCLVIALYGFSVLNPSWGGVALILLGVALLIIDLHAMTHGALTVAGLIALGFGMALLFQNEPGAVPREHVAHRRRSAAASPPSGRSRSARASRRATPAASGSAPSRSWGGPGRCARPGLVYVNGELWQAHADGRHRARPRRAGRGRGRPGPRADGEEIGLSVMLGFVGSCGSTSAGSCSGSAACWTPRAGRASSGRSRSSTRS